MAGIEVLDHPGHARPVDEEILHKREQCLILQTTNISTASVVAALAPANRGRGLVERLRRVALERGGYSCGFLRLAIVVEALGLSVSVDEASLKLDGRREESAC